MVSLTLSWPVASSAEARNTCAVLHSSGASEQGLDTAQLSYRLSSPMTTVTLCPG